MQWSGRGSVVCKMPRLSKGQQRGRTFWREPRLPCRHNIGYGCFFFFFKYKILSLQEGGHSILPDHPDISLSPALIPTGDTRSPLENESVGLHFPASPLEKEARRKETFRFRPLAIWRVRGDTYFNSSVLSLYSQRRDYIPQQVLAPRASD